jgi:probable F420-dependent oxidoreductase
MEFWQSVAFLETDQLTDIARAAEALGFTGILTGDHLIAPRTLHSRYPGTDDGVPLFAPETEWPDTWCAISAMAAVTDRLRFAPCIYIAPARDLVTVAKGFATASALSQGRCGFGVGIGWMEEEFAVSGQHFATRGARLDEMLGVLRALWAGGWVEHHGEHFDFDALQMSPTPVGEVRVWCGGNTEPGLRRAATRCEGWLNGKLMTADETIEVARRVRDLRRGAGLSLDDYAIVGGVSDPVDAALCRRLEDEGVTGLIVAPWLGLGEGAALGSYRSPVSTKVAAMEQYADTVIARL